MPFKSKETDATYRSTPEYREKAAARSAAWRKKNPSAFTAWFKKNKDHRRAYNKRYLDERPGLSVRRTRAWRTKNPEQQRMISKKSELKKYGLSPEDYEKMLDGQKGVCAICHQTDGRRRLSVDHDHATGKVRGLLCSKCNLCIGQAGDAPEVLRSAAAYLERTR